MSGTLEGGLNYREKGRKPHFEWPLVSLPPPPHRCILNELLAKQDE